MLRSKKLKQLAEEELLAPKSHNLSAAKRKEISEYLLAQAAKLERGEKVLAFLDGDIEVCPGCGSNLEKGCTQRCAVKAPGFTYMEKLEEKIRSKGEESGSDQKDVSNATN